MRLRVGGTTYSGRVVDLRSRPVSGRAVVASIRGERCLPVVSCADPTAVYAYAGHVRPGMGVRTRTAIAAAARSLGHETPHDDEIEACRADLAEFDLSPPSLVEPAETVPESTIAGLQEAVATHRGRVNARRAAGGDVAAAQADLREAATELSERQTQRTAATQTRLRRRESAREYRNALEDRRRLSDKLANLERTARATLVDRLRDDFGTAVAAVPSQTPTDPFEADPVTAALAVLRLARTPAPVVLETDRFRSPSAAAGAIEAPIVRC